MAETIQGSCHCRAVTFSVRFSEPIATSKCNCSICTPTRFWKALVPAAEFSLDTGTEALGTYRFASGTIAHHYCTRCGVKLHGVLPGEVGEQVAVSVPTLRLSPERLAGLPITYQDGANDDYDHPPKIVDYL